MRAWGKRKRLTIDDDERSLLFVNFLIFFLSSLQNYLFKNINFYAVEREVYLVIARHHKSSSNMLWKHEHLGRSSSLFDAIWRLCERYMKKINVQIMTSMLKRKQRERKGMKMFSIYFKP